MNVTGTIYEWLSDLEMQGIQKEVGEENILNMMPMMSLVGKPKLMESKKMNCQTGSHVMSLLEQMLETRLPLCYFLLSIQRYRL